MNLDGLTDELIVRILTEATSFAIIGASNKPERPSYDVMRFLIARGYDVHPVNPGLAGQMIQGRAAYARLADVPAPVDVVDIFRNSRDALGAVRDAVAEKTRLGVKVVWMQLGVVNGDAFREATAAGLVAVMDRCPKIEISRLRVA